MELNLTNTPSHLAYTKLTIIYDLYAERGYSIGTGLPIGSNELYNTTTNNNDCIQCQLDNNHNECLQCQLDANSNCYYADRRCNSAAEYSQSFESYTHEYYLHVYRSCIFGSSCFHCYPDSNTNTQFNNDHYLPKLYDSNVDRYNLVANGICIFGRSCIRCYSESHQYFSPDYSIAQEKEAYYKEKSLNGDPSFDDGSFFKGPIILGHGCNKFMDIYIEK
jgi:hypothetical protein